MGNSCLHAGREIRLPTRNAVEFKINLLPPAIGERFIARVRVVIVGGNVGVASAEKIAQVPAKCDAVVALMQATMMRVESKNGSGG